MTIRFRCTDCKKPLKAEDRYAGTKVKCPQCGRPAVVPKAVEKPPAEIEPFRFTRKHESLEEVLDMTPMVDITFLLLIFFMVTAAFSLQKSLEVPPPDQQESAAQARTVEDFIEDDYVIVRIDEDNTVWVDESEVPSEQELLVKLRQARKGSADSGSTGLANLLVLADGDARHETVVRVLDAGHAVGMENVRLAKVDEDDY